MTSKMIGVAVAAVIALGGCASTPDDGLTDSDQLRSALERELDGPGIGVSVNLILPIWIVRGGPGTVYFAKLDETGSLIQDHIFPSSYAWNGRAYAYNVEAGTYVVVAASYNMNGGSYTTFFPQELVQRTRVIVGKNEFAFMGRHSVYMRQTLIGADTVQKHYARAITLGLLVRLLTDNTAYCGIAKKSWNDEASAKTFFKHALKDLTRFRLAKAAEPSEP